MEELTLSINEAAIQLAMSTKTVYDWIYKNKFKHTDTISGKCILITQQEIDDIRERNISRLNRSNSKNIIQSSQKYKESSEIFIETPQDFTESYNNFIESSVNSNNFSQKFTENNISENTVMLSMMEQIRELSGKVESYAKSEGKVELLTSNIIQEKEDAEFYKNEYFKLKYDNELLQKSNNEMLEKIKELEARNKSGFFNFFKR